MIVNESTSHLTSPSFSRGALYKMKGGKNE